MTHILVEDGEPARLANKIFKVAAFAGATEFWKLEHFSGAAAVPRGFPGCLHVDAAVVVVPVAP